MKTKQPRFRYWQEYLRDKFDRQKKRNTVIYTETTGSDGTVVSTATYGEPSDIVYCQPTQWDGMIATIPHCQPALNQDLIDLRTNHPSIFDEFVEQQQLEFDLFLKKNKNYGIENIWENGTEKKEALQGLYFRMRDKLNRFKQLIENNSGDEPIIDTLQDLSNYSNIAIIVEKDRWK